MDDNDSERVKQQIYAVIQDDEEIAIAVSEAIKRKKRDFLTSIVMTVAKSMPTIILTTTLVSTVVDWLIDLFDTFKTVIAGASETFSNFIGQFEE